MSALEPFDFANTILQIAFLAVPSVLGVGAVGVFSHAIVSTGRALGSEAMGVLKFGALVLTGAVVGGVGGFVAGSGVASASGGAVGGVLRTAGVEALRGGVQGALGPKGVISTLNRAFLSEQVERDVLERMGGKVSYTLREVGEGGEVREVTVSRPALDRVGKFAERSERIIVESKPPPQPQSPQSPLVTPYTNPEEWRKGMEEVERTNELIRTYGEREGVRRMKQGREGG